MDTGERVEALPARVAGLQDGESLNLLAIPPGRPGGSAG